MPVMSEEWQIANQENKNRWFLGNQDAINFVNRFFDAVELWDDLIDKDVEITDDHINGISQGRFWSRYRNDIIAGTLIESDNA